MGSISDYNHENGFSSPNKVKSPSKVTKQKLPPKLAVKASLKKKAVQMARQASDMKMNKVHQDDDYIYPALGNASLIFPCLLCVFKYFMFHDISRRGKYQILNRYYILSSLYLTLNCCCRSIR